MKNHDYRTNTSAANLIPSASNFSRKGFFWNFVASHQSGLIGFCKYSEKSQTEIREQDNPHI